MKLAYALLFLMAIAFAGCGGCTRTEDIGTSKEIASESMEKSGDTWHVKFQTKIDAPPDKVYEAFAQPERSHEFSPDNVMKSELVSQNGNTKVVDIVGKLDVLPPGFKVQDLRTEFTLYPDEKRITSKSVDFKLADLASEYKFEPADGGKATLITFTQTSKDKGGLPVESLQKGALKETYVRQVQMVNKALGLNQAPATTPPAGG
jgi:Polyketide cyclase / dehydrase and lipid transport